MNADCGEFRDAFWSAAKAVRRRQRHSGTNSGCDRAADQSPSKAFGRSPRIGRLPIGSRRALPRYRAITVIGRSRASSAATPRRERAGRACGATHRGGQALSSRRTGVRALRPRAPRARTASRRGRGLSGGGRRRRRSRPRLRPGTTFRPATIAATVNLMGQVAASGSAPATVKVERSAPGLAPGSA